MLGCLCARPTSPRDEPQCTGAETTRGRASTGALRHGDHVDVLVNDRLMHHVPGHCSKDTCGSGQIGDTLCWADHGPLGDLVLMSDAEVEAMFSQDDESDPILDLQECTAACCASCTHLHEECGVTRRTRDFCGRLEEEEVVSFVECECEIRCIRCYFG